jgi:dipeptidyl aminopeptidase/acylaminoacyl peptidase
MEMEEKRAIQPDDLYKLHALAEPQIASGGQFIAMVVISADEEQDGYLYDLHFIDRHSGQVSIISSGANKVRSLRFSPDGTKLAFIVTQEDNEEHVYVAETASLSILSNWSLNAETPSEAEHTACRDLFTRKKLAGELYWIPDGTGLVLAEVSTTVPDVKEYANVYFKTDGTGLLRAVKTHFWWVPLEGEPRKFYTEESGIGWMAVSPNGDEIAFTRQKFPDTGSWEADIYLVNLESGTKRRLTESEGPIRSITYSSTGGSLIWIGHQSSASYGTESLWMTDLESGRSRPLLPHFDRPTGVIQKGDVSPVNSSDKPVLSADGRSVYFVAQDGGPTHVYKLTIDNGALVRMTGDTERCVSHFSVSPEGDVVFVSSTQAKPEELYLLHGGREEQLTGVNEAFCRLVSLAQAERIVFEGADNWPIEGWLMLPPANASTAQQAPYPLVVVVHGGPHGAFGCGFTLKHQTLCGSGFAVLYVNPRGSQAYGTDFAAAVIGDWGGKDYIDIMNAVDKVVLDGLADAARLGVTGYSYGGFMTTWMIGHTDKFRAAAPGGCVSNLISFQGTSDIGKHWGPKEHLADVYDGFATLWSHSPIAYVKNVTTPTLLYHAEGDDRCPIGQSEEFYTALRDLGKEAVFVRYPGGSHSYSTTGKPSYRVDTNERLNHWFRDKLRTQ